MLASVGVDRLQHRQQVHRVAGLVAAAGDGQDHLPIASGCRLAVVVLQPAITAIEDLAVCTRCSRRPA